MIESQKIFKQGSRTYYTSSLFFPAAVRLAITQLYAFVRTVDDFIDTVPQQAAAYRRFKQDFYQARQGQSSESYIINDYLNLERKYDLQPAWMDSFFASMDQDIDKKTYGTLDEAIEYMYGSAEVIGLIVARLTNLPREADQAARMHGRAMQYINFIRDIAEDHQLGRTYLPIPFRLLTKEYARQYPADFNKLIREQIRIYRQWQAEATQGYIYIPKRYLIPIKTAADMYEWTARQIDKYPAIVFDKKVKPGKLAIIIRALSNAFSI